MTLLTIGQAVADEVNVTRPSSIAGGATEEGLRILRYANKCGTKLMKAYPWQALRAEQTFTAVAGAEQTSILPADFDRFIPETFWDRTNSQLVTGPVSPVEWQSMKANSYAGAPRFAWRGDTVLISPDRSGGATLAFEYVSANWCQSSSGTGQEAFMADTDTALVNEELVTLGTIYEYLAGEDLPWQKARADYMEFYQRLTRNERARTDVLLAGDVFGGGRHFGGAPSANAGGLFT